MCRGDMYPCTQDEFHPINSVSKNSIVFDINDQNIIIGIQLYQFDEVQSPAIQMSLKIRKYLVYLSMLHNNQ